MSLLEFLSKPEESARRLGPGSDKIIFSSRVRLARNIAGAPFPGWAKKSDRVRVLDQLLPAVTSLPQMQDALAERMEALSPLEKQLLVERHLISREHAAKSTGSGLVLKKDETICIMINEEDHLRMQVLLPGFNIRQAWQMLDSLDSALEERVQYAFHPEFGYLTGCPTNVGTGIRASVMMHLPGLVLSEQMNPVIQAANKLGMTVRGLYGEGTDALGNLFQVSNQMTLGESESTIIERLEKVTMQILEHEQNARATLLDRNPTMIYNHIGRAYGILANSFAISSKEAMNLLSMVRLGADLGLFPEFDKGLLQELFLLVQPAHLQQVHGRKLSGDERDVLRASMLRQKLRAIGWPEPSPSQHGPEN